MVNYYNRKLHLQEINKDLQERYYLEDVYFNEVKEVTMEEKSIEELLESFTEESEYTKKIKLDIMKKIKKDMNLDKYEIFNLASSYINKYKYNLKLLNDENIFEFNKLAN